MTLSVGDRVLCYHGPKLYEAKIIQYTKENGIAKYFVHYKGWKSKWDEWVGSDRIVELDNDGLKLQKILATKFATSEPKATETEKENENDKFDIPVLFKLGKNFKHFANYDWIQINKKSKILKSPVEFSAASFLRQYSETQPKCILTTDFVEKFIALLDVYIGKSLLYRQERLNYLPLDKSLGGCSLYGPEILIRFFARLNIFLQNYSKHTNLSEFLQHFSKISDYLMKYLSDWNAESAYVTRSDHYETYYSIN